MESNEKNEPALAGLRNLRQSMGMSQKELAERMDLAAKHISRYETMERLPRLPIMRRIFQVLKCHLWQLFYDPTK